MELEKAKAVTLQLEREVEALEVERLEMKTQLRHLSLQASPTQRVDNLLVRVHFIIVMIRWTRAMGI